MNVDRRANTVVGRDLDVIRDGARLSALRDLGLLDAPAEASLDRLTRLAATMLDVPVSLVSLVDIDRQFFAGRYGFDDAVAPRQTPLSHSLCQYVVAGGEPLVIEDTRAEPALADNLAVRDQNVTAYAGIPLVLEDGSAVGAFCALDFRPRQWTDRELSLLGELAATAQELLNLRAAVAQEGLYDRLTGLPNRSLLVAHAEQMLSRPRGSGALVVMCVGLDDFTQINEALGTDHADEVLRAAGRRLAASLRPDDVLGRLRGDIFTILANGVVDEQEALGIAGRLRSTLSATPLEIGNERLSVSATIGITISKTDARAADLLSEAANAMRQAKRHHARARVAQDGWGEQAATQLRLREALRGALDRHEITAAFQPVVELDSGQVRGYEALARWHHPELGHVSPAEFIPAAEATGDIVPIGAWMLARGCAQLAEWRARGLDLTLSVNLAPLQLEQPNLAELVQDILERAGVPGSALVLEITEGVLLQNAAVQHDNLRALRQLGIRIALDDFGTGYSALGYLKRFPIDIIKIDRSFITGIETERHDTALVHAILAMATGMDLALVAEGIETPTQHQLLRLLGCRLGQGFLFSKPLPAEEIDPTENFSPSPPRSAAGA